MKEELRKEFLSKESDTDYLPGYQKSNALFDWFYSKLEAKDKEIAELKEYKEKLLFVLSNSSTEILRLSNEVTDLKAKMEAAEKDLKK